MFKKRTGLHNFIVNNKRSSDEKKESESIYEDTQSESISKSLDKTLNSLNQEKSSNHSLELSTLNCFGKFYLDFRCFRKYFPGLMSILAVFLIFAWSFGLLNIPGLAMNVPVALVFARCISFEKYSDGYFNLDQFGIVVGAIYYYTFKISIFAKRVTLVFLKIYDYKLYNVFFCFILYSTGLSLFLPDYFVVFLGIPLVERIFKILNDHYNRPHLGKNMEEIRKNLKKYRKCFLLGLCYSATVGSTCLLSNSAASGM